MATDKVQTGLRLDYVALRKMTIIAKKQMRSLNAQLEFITQNFIEQYEKEHGKINLDEF
ncbi:MAG: Arc family DNA-binding protein [Firmicutes bacterium]|nr:Arc family DNA-binding protein [Bacillota bacterium]